MNSNDLFPPMSPISESDMRRLVEEIAGIADNPPDIVQAQVEIHDQAAARVAMAARIVSRMCRMEEMEAYSYLVWLGAEQMLRPLAHLHASLKAAHDE